MYRPVNVRRMAARASRPDYRIQNNELPLCINGGTKFAYWV